ncbi:MAG: GNAT family N-acetyltransferase [Alphaproteobacteria bacterium]|nr:GNAT family N-acetyltransferase [Alphaproteobacteria bacterium]
MEIDLQTFSESTFSEYAAAAMLRNGHVYLLSFGDQVIGTCVTMRCWDRPNEAMILSMGIKPGWRGQGLGQHFIRGVLQKLRQRGLRSACLYVSTDNRRAIKVYEDVGFVVVERGVGVSFDRSELNLLRVTFQESQPVIELS